MTQNNAREHTKLPRIIQQLKFCRYECDGGVLENNAAFIGLEEISKLHPDPIREIAEIKAFAAMQKDLADIWKIRAESYEMRYHQLLNERAKHA